jgi:hypothetical protein
LVATNLEAAMKNRTDDAKDKQGKDEGDEGLLERIAKAIDPPGRDVSDDELIDPGSNIPDSRPAKPQKGPQTNQGAAESGIVDG